MEKMVRHQHVGHLNVFKVWAPVDSSKFDHKHPSFLTQFHLLMYYLEEIH